MLKMPLSAAQSVMQAEVFDRLGIAAGYTPPNGGAPIGVQVRPVEIGGRDFTLGGRAGLSAPVEIWSVLRSALPSPEPRGRLEVEGHPPRIIAAVREPEDDHARMRWHLEVRP